jgi:hypothetical protein
MRLLHRLILMIPAALLLLVGGYVYATAGYTPKGIPIAEQIPGWRRSLAEAASGKKPMDPEKTAVVTERLIDVVESQTAVANTAVGFARSAGAWMLLLGVTEALAILYVARRCATRDPTEER